MAEREEPASAQSGQIIGADIDAGKSQTETQPKYKGEGKTHKINAANGGQERHHKRRGYKSARPPGRNIKKKFCRYFRFCYETLRFDECSGSAPHTTPAIHRSSCPAAGLIVNRPSRR